MTKKYLPPEYEVDLFSLSSLSVVTTSSTEIPGEGIEDEDIDLLNALEY